MNTFTMQGCHPTRQSNNYKAQGMYSLITFATQWGSKHGGINSFNTDFLSAFGYAYHSNAQIICIVSSATAAEIEQARNDFVTLLPLPYPPQEKTFSKDQAQAAIELMKQRGIDFDPNSTIWLGHDRISGEAAIEAAKLAGGRSALIHHMSYAHYESFAEDSQTAHLKNQEQQRLFEQADLILAIGPLLRDAAHDLVSGAKPVHMLVPGLAEIEAQSAPKTFVAFLGGRLSGDAARVKQGYLSVAALAHAHKRACEIDMPAGLCKQPRLMLRGVDFAAEENNQPDAKPEAKLKAFAEGYADRAITILALPYTHDRNELYSNISKASAVMMLSWHEGFGLAAWEAIAAGVPLILSKHSGVYKLLEENHPGCEKGFIYPIDVRGTNAEPFFRQEDLEAVAVALREIAHQPEKARQKAGTLRGLLLNEYSWAACAEQAAKIFAWPLSKGVLPSVNPKPITQAPEFIAPTIAHNELPVHMPKRQRQTGETLTDSQLLRAEEALVPFDPARQPELDKLDVWLDDPQYPQAIRLLTGAGGLGKTRLALELCQRRIDAGWHAGFLDSDLDAKALASGWQALQALNQPLLIVIDYAETRQSDLITLIKTMLQNLARKPVRFLLLARDGGEWWDNLPGKSSVCEPLLSGYATSGPYHLPTLHDELQDRRHAYKQALNAFANALGAPAPNVTPELEGEHFGRPLYLQMAALLALRGERPTTAQGLTRALLSHERRYWQGLFADHDLAEPERHAEQLLALTTLAGGFTTTKVALPYWQRATDKVLNTAQFNQLFNTLMPLYPGKQGLQAVRPDLLGEALVAQALLRSTAADLLDAVLGKDASQAMRLSALTVIARLSNYYQELHETLIDALKRHLGHCWQEFVIAAIETPSDLPALAKTAFDRLLPNSKNQVANALAEHAREESVQLAEFYCQVTSCLAAMYHQRYLKKPDATHSMSNYAISLNNYAISLHFAGDNDQALLISFETLSLFRKLYKLNQQSFEPDFAMSLLNHANRLSDSGRNNDALEHAQQASEIYGKLTLKNPERFESDYATSLSNYTIFLSAANRNQDALDIALQALNIRQQLAKNNSDQNESNLAGSLSNCAIFLVRAGRNNEALQHEWQALQIRQRLAHQKPDRFEPDLANSLSNYGGRLSDIGHNEEALDYARQSLAILEKLAQKNPARFAEGQFSATSHTYLLEWLTGNTGNDRDLTKLNSVPETTPHHRRPLLQLSARFVQACYTPDPTIRFDAFKQVITLRNDLSQSDSINTQDTWLCAAAWCAAHEPLSIVGINWDTEWHQFSNQRQGNIPQWMLEVARRLDFKWPE
ncbi:MAG: hypothetical protein A2063_09475 [Gallionellales bacterium GWA2_60_142]|nr:MAG: hypothetical protein A2063_09475 [Gallionellales bacterium GWA2_60_142]